MMAKRSCGKWLVGLILLLILAAGWWRLGRGRNERVRQYQAELRAKGEKLTYAELGYPVPATNTASLAQLTNAVASLTMGMMDPARFAEVHFAGPGRMQVAWALTPALLGQYEIRRGAFDWNDVCGPLEEAGVGIAKLRAATEQPNNCFLSDPAGTFRTNSLHYPFVPMRNAANWLMADAMAALHIDDPRALADVHALVQLTEFNKQDPALMAQMIRVVIAGVGLQATWHTLQKPGWNDAQLAALQADWSRMDFFAGLELGIQGERARSLLVFDDIRRHGAHNLLGAIGYGSRNQLLQKVGNYGAGLMWRLNAEEDELQVYRSYQQYVENIRAVPNSQPWSAGKLAEENMIKELNRLMGTNGGLSRFRYLFTSLIIPNYVRPHQTVVQTETQRRLTVVAIALQRYQLRHGKAPAQLSDLVPEFLAAAPLDPMSGKAFGYRLDPAGQFVLYSVGEDGVDEQGDATPVKPTQPNTWWSGRDVVWPKPDFVERPDRP